MKFIEKTTHNTFWKFNTALLQDKQYLDKINELVDSIIVEYAVFAYARDSTKNIPKNEIQFLVSDETLLDFLLIKIRSEMTDCICNNDEEEKDIQKLEKSDKSQEDCNIMNGKKTELKAIRGEKIEGALLRSKARGIAHGEKVTSYFCSLEKRH